MELTIDELAKAVDPDVYSNAKAKSFAVVSLDNDDIPEVVIELETIPDMGDY